MKTKQYVAILYFGGEGYSVTFPDLPGCASYGLTMQSAATNAEIALNGHIGLMIRDGDPLPDPTPLDEIDPLLDPEGKDVGRVLIRAEIPEAVATRKAAPARRSFLSPSPPVA